MEHHRRGLCQVHEARAIAHSAHRTSKEVAEAILCRKQTGWPQPEQVVSQCSAHRLQRRIRGCSRCRSNLCLNRRVMPHLLSLPATINALAAFELAQQGRLIFV